VTVSDGRVSKVGPNKAHPHSAGAFCAKGIRALPQWTYGERRLLHPLERLGARGAGQWQRIGWDEALELVADGFAAVIRRHGAASVAGAVSGAFFSRGPVMALLMRALGSPNWLINQDLCGGCRAVSDRVTGLAIGGGEDIEHTRCALVVGRNPYAADPIQWRALEAARKRGAALVVIDPNRSPAAERADLWLRPRPGTDAAIALAMMQVIIAEQRHDHDFVQRWCHGFDALAERVAAYPPARAEALTGVPADQIVQAARRYADGPSVFVSGHGIDAFSAGFQTFRAFHCLLAICGNVDRLGGNRRAKRPPGLRTWMDLLHDPALRLPPEVEARRLGAQRFPLWSGAGAWQGACHNPAVLDAILTGEREKNFHHSRFRDQPWLEQLSPDPQLRVHPDTAARHALHDGEWAYVHTAAGRCRLKVTLSERVPPDVVSTGMGWWRPRGEGPEYGALDVNVNAALSYAGPYDPVTGSPDSRGIPCRISAAR
jgi:anaerobic selenocysteine-containing dehydrogenase